MRPELYIFIRNFADQGFSFHSIARERKKNMKEKPKIGLVILVISAVFLSAPAVAQTCPEGDLNGDCTVNMKDLFLLAQYWLDIYSLADFAVLAQNWYQSKAPPVINEFMASNSNTLLDGDGQSSDWIEIYNPRFSSINLKDWYLTDDESNLTKWRFPDVNQLEAGEFMVVFASDKDDASYPYIDSEGYCHTNFGLKKDGEYLALVEADGVTIAHEYTPEFPEQLRDISYGLLQNATTVVSFGDEVRYYVPLDSSDETTWMLPGFDDSTWSIDQTSLDFGTGNVSSTGLVARYDFETGTNDSSGNNLHGTLQGDAAIIPDSGGNAKTASNVLTVDGTGDYVDCGNDSVFNIGSNITVAAYVKNNGWVWGWAAVACKGNAWRLRRTETGPSDDTISFVCNGLSPFQVIGTTNIDDNQWHHIAGVYNGMNFSVYVDGQLDNSITATGTITPNTYELYIGASSHHGGDYAWNGLIDDVHIYERALQLSEVQSLAESDSPSALQSAMKGVNASLWIRIEFNIADNPNIFDSFVLRMKYEDGFVAYINGQEVARRNAPNPVQWNSTALSDRSIEDHLLFEDINIMAYLNCLQVGTNTLAIHGLNDDKDNGDFLILPELVIARNQQSPQYFSTPTPGTFNVPGALGIVSNVWFSHERGFYNTPFQLSLFTEMDEAEIRYTLDGSQPTINHGTVFSGPITINHTTAVRAVAVRPGWLDSYSETHTYIFLDDVTIQPNNPSGFPNDWKGNYLTLADLPLSQQVPADYEMDPDIVSGSETQVKEALLSIPTISIVTDVDNLFDLETGIYSNSWMGGLLWERPASAEYFDPNGNKEFQVDCGLRIHGGWFRKPLLTNKHSFRLLFKADYGPTKLKFMMFDDEDATDSFDSIVLRAVGGDGYSFQSIGGRAQYIRDQFGRELQLDMAHTASHGIFVHLYIDGLYWGLYNVVERPEASFCETYFGGDKDNWDVIKIDRSTEQIAVANGSIDAWNEMLSQIHSGLSTNEAYQRIQGNNPDGTPNESYEDYLEIENYIDYMIANLYVGNTDWPQWNWYAVRDRSDGRTGFRFFMWDVEGSLDDGVHSYFGIDRTDVGSPTAWRAVYGPGVAEPYHELRNNAEFQMLFADHLHKAFFNGGPLTTEAAANRYSCVAKLIDSAMIGECARWGDQHFATPFVIGDWRNERDRLLTNYFTVTSGDNRQEIVLEQFRDGGLYPSLYPDVPAPVFYIDGGHLHGGYVPANSDLIMTKPGGSGTLYYTLDGKDPRLIGGTVRPGSLIFTGSAVELTKSTHVKARVLDSGEWSALNEAVFAIGPVAENLRITEIMYHPKYTNNPDDPNEEFIELKNIGESTLNLNLVRFTNGIDFTFSDIIVTPGGYVVVVRDSGAFSEQYLGFSGTIAGQYTGKLDNGGERIVLEDANRQTIHSFRYDDDWRRNTDGEGFSLTIIDPDSSDPNNWNEKESWRASGYNGGSPGADDTGQVPNPGTVVINEVLAHTDTEPNDCIELYNTTDSTIDISGWFLSDNDYNLTKYEIPASTEITAGGYIVFTQDDDFGGSFSLSENGETICLSSGLAGELTGYREEESFGASDNNVSFGRHLKSTGTFNFVSMSSKTMGYSNAYPKVGPIVISEIMYNPATNNQNLEYIELHNIESSAITLYDFDKNIPWKFTDGIKLTFPSNPPVTIPAGGYLLVVKNPDTFASTYTFGGDILGPYDGFLSNGGEKVEISKPGDLDEYGIRHYIRVDRVNYSDGSNHDDFEVLDPWPISADGGGNSLTRIHMDLYGNDPNNWNAVGPTLGSPSAQLIFINEFMAANDTTIHDEYGEYDDWIEIFNASGSTVELGGMYLADDTDMYLIPDGVTVDAGGYKIFWADDESGQGNKHTNFKLAKSGDDITLFDTDGITMLDSIMGFEGQTDDVSYGRYPDGVNNWGFFDSPTPADENGRHSNF